MPTIPDADKSLLPRQPNLSLAEGLRLLQFVMAMGRPVGVSEIARELDLEKTRSHRLLRTLASLGYLQRTDAGLYTTGQAVPILATLAMQSAGFTRDVFPYLDELYEKTNLLVAYAVRWNRMVAYLYFSDPSRSKNAALGGHEVFPASKSRLGRVILAGLPDSQIRALYTGHRVEGFDSIDGLIEHLEAIRTRGYLFEGTNDATKINDMGVTIRLPKTPNTAIGIVGDITRAQVPKYLKLLNEVTEKIEVRRVG